jgi:uncharacterized membrane protein YoaK (UPF0700 family)
MDELGKVDRVNWPGWCLCFVFGLLDAICYLALGGAFAGLMAGNLVLMGLSLGDFGLHAASFVYLFPILGFTLAAVVAGAVRPGTTFQSLKLDLLWTGWSILLATCLIVWSGDPEHVTAIGWLVVTTTAACLGFLSGALFLSRRYRHDTQERANFLSDGLSHLVSYHAAGSKVFAILMFLFGAVVGGLIYHSAGIGYAFTLALVVSLVSIIGEVKTRVLAHSDVNTSPPSMTQSP